MEKMKLFLVTICFILISGIAKSQTGNYALCLDGLDNNPCIGMDIIKNQWTLEAWIKGNGKPWKNREAIIGTGEYGEINTIDQLPLMLKNGKLCSPKAGLVATEPLDDKWHHVAVSCNGTETKLYLDGKEIGSKKFAVDILPGEIGTSDIDSTGFSGCIDEVRIWSCGVSGATLSAWMYRPLGPGHPDFNRLKGYYNFDNLENDVSLNLVGKGAQAYHLRNTRKKYNGDMPLAYLVKNDNPLFVLAEKKQQVFNAVVIQSEWDADQNAKNDELLKLRIVVNGSRSPLKLTALNLDFSGSTSLSDMARVHVYYAGQSPRSATRIELFGKGKKPGKAIRFTEGTARAYPLKEGVNYFLVTLDLNRNAVAGNRLHAKVSSFLLGHQIHIPEEDKTANIPKLITPNSATNPNAIKLLQWNIWHGGLHLGHIEGPNRVKELMRNTNADIITLEEGYGTQTMLASALGFELQTASPTENLAIISRFKMKESSSNAKFKSNVATVTLPNNKKILIGNWWLRYASKHEYTGSYANTGLNSEDWVKEDRELGAVDAQTNLDKDIDPILRSDPTLPVIIAGDFNSGSHLDWTARAAFLHYGYGPVDFPISKLMLQRGYTDSYRILYPDEVTYPGGTFAAIYGHMQTSRIDYIYSKGLGLKAMFSKIIRTPPQIDDVWPSDHSAVLTVFYLY
jgi:endonuclease/exonuclease/phosphatase family metal-dependent hydrolase